MASRCTVRSLALPALLGLLVLAPGCLEPLPSPALVDDLRVLAVRAEPPEVAPGTTVQLDALVVDPQLRPPTYAWYACIIVGQTFGFFGGGSETTTSGGNGNPLSTDPYGGSCQRRFEAGERFAFSLGNAPTATLTIPADLFADDEALKLAYAIPEDITIDADVKTVFLGIAGINYTVSLVVEVDGRRIETDKRVNVSEVSLIADNPRNVNPRDLAIFAADKADGTAAPATAPAPADGRCLAGDPAPFIAGERYQLTPLNIPDPQPKYAVLLAGTTTDELFEIKTTEETSFYSWFATRGNLQKVVSKAPGQPVNEWHLHEDDIGMTDLWVVVRDGRGGVSWCHETVDVTRDGGP